MSIEIVKLFLSSWKSKSSFLIQLLGIPYALGIAPKFSVTLSLDLSGDILFALAKNINDVNSMIIFDS